MGTDDGNDDRDTEDVESQAPSSPLVFISHDTRDAGLAEALSKLLSSVSAGMLKTFRSSDHKGGQGFEYGVEWFPELMRQLESACDVVCLFTELSLGRPWLLYEAGVAKGKLDIPVHGLALGIPLSKASVGPFAQFQNCGDDGDSITKLVEQLVRRLPNAEPDHDTVKTQVDIFKERVASCLAEQVTDTDEATVEQDEASTAKLFEEIKVMFQDLPSRIDVAAERVREPRVMRKLHPGMIHEMIHLLSRDELPWLYEMGVEVYRQSLTAKPTVALRRAYSNFLEAAHMASRAPFSRELRSARTRMFLDDLLILLRDFEPAIEKRP